MLLKPRHRFKLFRTEKNNLSIEKILNSHLFDDEKRRIFPPNPKHASIIIKFITHIKPCENISSAEHRHGSFIFHYKNVFIEESYLNFNKMNDLVQNP